ncbi:MAG: serine/threonine-protein kinase [Pirellulales bacterium]
MDKAEFEYLGPYHVQGVLGRGGMGTVYKGLHAKSGQPVAIKAIAPSIADNPRFRRRFAGEIETLVRLRHPNIVQIIGYGEEKGLLFYAMEFVDGVSVHEQLRKQKVMPWETVIQIAIEVAGALKHAHDIGIIHRDLKPANLMLGKDGRTKMTDFGIAKFFGSTDMTAVGAVIGTADFMPPEQAEGKTVTVRSDLYSLGSVMFAMLTGRAPFYAKTVPEVLYAVRYTPAPDTTSLAPEAPTDLHALIAELLEKDPQKRPPTALVVGNRLKAMQQGIAKLGTAIKTSVPDVPITPNKIRDIGPELTSIDLSDSDDEDLRVTGTPENTRERPTIPAPVTAESNAPTRKPISAKPSKTFQASAATQPYGSEFGPAGTDPLGDDEFTTGEEEGPSTASHYTTVSEADKRRFTLSNPDDEATSGFDWVHYGSIAGLVILLLGAIGFGIYALQPASADSMYTDIQSAIDSGSDTQLLDALPTIEEFRERFPNDPRAADLKEIEDESELLRSTRNLQRRARKGDFELSALEQAYLDAMLARNQDDADARSKLDAFLSVFGNAEKLPAKSERYIELARFARTRLDHVKLNPTSAAAEELAALIRTAEGKLSGEKLKQFYANVELLYGDKPWAREQINRVRSLNSESK